MTNTNDLGEVFPAGTAAHRIEQSIRALTAGFRYRLLERESHGDEGVAARAEGYVNNISLQLQQLVSALSDAAPLLTSQGVKVEGRDIEEEDRAVIELLGELAILALDSSALSDQLKSWAAVRAFKGRRAVQR